MSESNPERTHALWRELDDLTKQRLKEAMRKPLDDEGVFLAEMWVGSCIHCGSELTMDLTEVEDLENPAVGLCKQCGGMWCIECYAPIVASDLECGHYAICVECGECDVDSVLLDESPGGAEKEREPDFDDDDLFEDEIACINPRDCELVRTWLIKQGFSKAEDFEQDWEDMEDALFYCAWCNRELLPGDHICWSRLNLKPGFDLRGEEGLIIPLHLPAANRTIPAIFTSLESPDRAREKRLVIMTCSDECSHDLKEAFRLEQDISDRFNIN
jgi:hypothetical protein